MVSHPKLPAHAKLCQGTRIFHFDLAAGDAGAEDEPQ